MPKLVMQEMFKRCSQNLKGKFKLSSIYENPEFLEYMASDENRDEIKGIKKSGDEGRDQKRTIKQKNEDWWRGKAAEYLLIYRTGGGFKDNPTKYCDVIFTDSEGNEHNVEVKTNTGSRYALNRLDERLKQKRDMYEKNKVDFLVYFYYNKNDETIWFQTVDLMSYHI